MTNPIAASITPPRETAPAGTDKRTRCAYAICRRILKGACPCEHVGNVGEDVCSERLFAAMDAEAIFTGEG